jgi:hypothetical protein
MFLTEFHEFTAIWWQPSKGLKTPLWIRVWRSGRAARRAPELFEFEQFAGYASLHPGAGKVNEDG